MAQDNKEPMPDEQWELIRRDLHAGRLLNHDDRQALIREVERLRTENYWMKRNVHWIGP